MITVPSPYGIIYLPMFPAGLLVVMQPSGSEEGSLVLGWSLYAVQAGFLFFTSRRNRFWIAYAILVVMLTANVAGCRKMLHELQGLH